MLLIDAGTGPFENTERIRSAPNVLTMTRSKSDIHLPQGVQAIGLTEEQVARSWGISPTQFAELRRKNPELFPRARRAGNRKLYSRIETEEKFHQLPLWEDDEIDADTDEWSVD